MGLSKVEKLLDLMLENISLPLHYPLHKQASQEEEEKFIKPAVFHALILVEKMLEGKIDTASLLKRFKLVICTNTNVSLEKLICSAVREEIVFKYIN